MQVRNRVIALREAGRVVHAFHGGEPFFETPLPIKAATAEALAGNQTRYAPSSGIAPLREALQQKLAERNGIAARVEEILVTTGGCHALFAAFQAVLDPGDEVLVFSPFWTPIADMILGTGARPIMVPTAEALKTGLGAALESFLTASTRAIYYNTPQNPSGTVFTRAHAEEVAAFAMAHDLVVIADEAYEDIVYSGAHFSIASVPGMFERTITTYTFSKSYAMTGWRVGYAVAAEPFMSGLRKMVLYSTNGVSTPMQWAALEALKTPFAVLEERRDEYRARRDLLVDGLNQVGLPCTLPQGAFYAFPDVRSIDPDSRKAAAILLDEAQVATIPGIVFGAEGEGHVRFGYATSMEVIEAGLEALRGLGS